MTVALPREKSLPAVSSLPLTEIHQPFFLAAIAATLTAGAGWGAWLLLRIAASRSFTELSIFEVNAHGQAQIYGWVGLFVLGFAYRVVPRFWGTELAWPRLAWATLPLMVAGVAVRTFAEPLHAAAPGWSVAALAAGAAQVAAVAIFAAVVTTTFARARRRPEPADFYLLAATAWFVAGAAFDLFHLARCLAAPDRDALLAQVAVFQFALRDVQIHGLAMTLIFGISLRILPALFGIAPASRRISAALWLPLQLGIAGEVVSFVAFLSTRDPRWAAAMAAATGLVALAATAFVFHLGLFAPAADRTRRPDRSLKFLRAGQVWLVISLAMLLAGPFWGRLSGQAFSHAWYGATRHAVTVGFVTLTILGVAARAVAAFKGLDTRGLTRLWGPFLLVNLGCALRVGMQAATDLAPAAFPWAGVSGLLELTGLALWGAHLVALLRAPENADGFVRIGLSPSPTR